jgi:hypothetical protein
MGHGYFWTDPPDERPMVAFSRQAASVYVDYLSESGRVSCNQYATLQHQIAAFGLPDDMSPEVRQLVSECTQWEAKRVEFASIDQPTPEPFQLFGVEIAEIVHEFLLASPAHPELREH